MKRPQPQTHWTETSLDDYKSRITFDFLDQLADFMDAGPINQKALADKLGIGESAVSQFLNNPNNLSLKTIIKYTRALGLKVSLLAYDDGDPDNTRGPIGSRVFTECWVREGKPADLFDLHENAGRMPQRHYFQEQATTAKILMGNFSSTLPTVANPTRNAA